MPRTKATDSVSESGSGEVSPDSFTPVGGSFAERYAQAAQPFEKTFQRQIRGGRMLDYITGEQAASRMQEAYETYDWAVSPPLIVGTDVIVSGTITVTVDDVKISRVGYGGCQIKQFGGVTDLGNDVKAAETAAFKRAASKFGVGLYLYERDESAAPEPQYTPSNTVRQAPANLANVSFPSNNATGSGTTGVVERKSANGLYVNGQWYNVSKFAPIDLSPIQAGMTVTIAHAPGKTFIDGLSTGGSAPVAAASPEANGDEAF